MLCNATTAMHTARRKQKWSVDPRNSAWSKDDSKFGQKMLERMGWSKGEVSAEEALWQARSILASYSARWNINGEVVNIRV